MGLGKLVKKFYNPLIAVTENTAYYFALHEIDRFCDGDPPVWLGFIVLPIASYIFSDGVSRLLANTPIYKLKIEN